MSDAPAVVAIVLPAYDEERTIADSIRAFHAALPDATVVVVDNRSSDRTAAIAADVLSSLGSPTRLLSEARPGKGMALRRAFREVDADAYVVVDADMTYPASSVHELLAPVLAGDVDMCVGDRRSEGDYQRENRRPFHSVGNRIVQTLVNRLFGANLHDIMSGYRVLSREFVVHYPILVSGFEVETDMTLHALDKRFRVAEIPIRYQDRPEGSHSKLSTYADGIRVVWTIFRVLRYYRPLQFFAALGLLLALTGLAVGTPPIVEYLTVQYIQRVPLAILATGLGVLAALAFSVGLVLDSVVHQERMTFERELMRDRPSRGVRSKSMARR
jgi:glycosyltransferase involved in cell wall biosynthesis